MKSPHLFMQYLYGEIICKKFPVEFWMSYIDEKLVIYKYVKELYWQVISLKGTDVYLAKSTKDLSDYSNCVLN